MIVAPLEHFMNHENVDSRRMDLHRRIALVLRKEPGLIRDFAERLRSKLATAFGELVTKYRDQDLHLGLWYGSQ